MNFGYLDLLPGSCCLKLAYAKTNLMIGKWAVKGYDISIVDLGNLRPQLDGFLQL